MVEVKNDRIGNFGLSVNCVKCVVCVKSLCLAVLYKNSHGFMFQTQESIQTQGSMIWEVEGVETMFVLIPRMPDIDCVILTWLHYHVCGCGKIRSYKFPVN